MTKRTTNGAVDAPTATPIPTATPGEVSSDPFEDLASIRLGQDFDTALGVKRLITRVQVRRPDRQEWVRVRPGSEWRLDVSALEFREDRDWYLVLPVARGVLLSDLAPVRLHTAINRQGDLFLWPIKLPADGRRNPWLETAVDAACEAERRWVRLVAGKGCYVIYTASCPDLSDPDWPEESFNDLLRLAFRDRLVDRPDHPIVQRLAGAV
jgi:hypothetical protein